MARLGRGRRSGAIIKRARSIVTATPLIRKRVFVELDARTPFLKAHNRQRRAKAKILRGLRYAPTATPLIRKRLVLSPNSNDRARLRATFLKRHIPEITRAKLWWPLAPRPLVKQNASDAAARRTLFKRRPRIISRAPSVTTATPYIRPSIFTTRDLKAVRRALRGRRAAIKRAPSVTTATPPVRRQIFVKRDLRASVRRGLLGRGAALSRSPQPTPVPFIRKKVVFINRDLRAAIQRGLSGRGATLRRAPSVTTPTPFIRKQIFVRRDLRVAVRRALAGRGASLARSPQPTQLLVFVRKQAVVARTRRRTLYTRQRIRRVVRPSSFPVKRVKPIVLAADRRIHWRHRSRVILRSTKASPLPRQKQPSTHREVRTRLYRACGGRGRTPVLRARIAVPIVAPSVTRNRVLISPNAGNRAQQIKLYNAHRHAHIVYRPALPLTPHWNPEKRSGVLVGPVGGIASRASSGSASTPRGGRTRR